ncbi:acyl-CoA dehydrogenase [Comamonas sp.]|uniref:acyl-CoA dehydrogenase n=1 Tax=Comamonas sp. TaxID=34028 RepID=UPI002FCA580D
MLHYTPPLRELRFVLHEVLDAARQLQALPDHAAMDAATLDALAEEAGRFAAQRILPVNAAADAAGCRWADGEVSMPAGFADAYRAYCELGWPAICADARVGGQALPTLVFSVVNELVASASHAFVMIAAINHCAAACLRHSASAALQAQWLPGLASGRVLSSMCMTEPQAGSDIGLLTTLAVPGDQGSYRVSGSKIFASGAEHDLSDNIVHLVLARTPGAPAGSRGISLFLVPKRLEGGERNGVHCDGIEHKMGLHGSPTCALRFERARGWLVGELHAGLPAMFPMMNEARLLSGLQAVGLSELALQNARGYALERRQGRSPAGRQPCALVEHPDVQRMLLTQKAWTEGGRALVHWAALLIDQARSHPDADQARAAGELLGLLTPIIKGFLSENAQQSISLALQTFGGHGYMRDTGIEQLVRDARVITLYEGTTGIQGQDLLLRKVLGDGGRRLELLQAQVRDWLAGPGSSAAMAEFAAPLARLRDELQSLTATLGARERETPGAALAASTVFLRLAGHLVLAWLWARMAQASLEGAGRGDAWYALKLETARFYFTQMLPETQALRAAALAPATDTGALLAASH